MINHITPVIVTGATGFLGRHLVDALLRQGHEVYLLVRDQQKAAQLFCQPSVHILETSLMTPIAADILPAHALIIHAAAITGSLRAKYREYQAANVVATEHLLKAAIARQAVGFTFISSVSAVGAAASRQNPIDEDTVPQPQTYYGRSKLAAENVLRELTPTALPLTIIRSALIYGPRQTSFSGMGTLFRHCQRHWLPLLAGGASYLSLGYVGNIVEGILTLSHRNKGHEIFNVADPKPCQLKALAFEIQTYFKQQPRIIPIPYALGRLAGLSADGIAYLLQKDLGLCTELVKTIANHGQYMTINKALKWGYQPSTSFVEGVHRTLQGC